MLVSISVCFSCCLGERVAAVADLLDYAGEVLELALSKGGDLGEIFFEERVSARITFEDGKVDRVSSGTDVGAGLRLLVDDRTLYAYSNDVSRDGLLALAKTVSGGVSAEKRTYNFDFKLERHAMPVKVPPAEVPTARKVAMLVAADRIVRAHDRRIVQVMTSYSDSLRRIVIANSEGRYVEDVQPQVTFYVSAVASDRGVIQTGRQPIGGAMGFEFFDLEDTEAAALKAAKQASLMLDAAPAPTGRMPVVISSEAGGTMVHEAVGHGLEADHIDKQISKYCGRLGEMIAAPDVTVVDDGTLPFKRGSSSVDDEGTPTCRAVLVDKGRLVAFMNDLRTCRKMKLEPSGNGRRQSYEHKPVPRMRNTMIAPGSADPAEILASTPRGLYVKMMGGGQVNTLNGDFVFEVSEGYLIENGKAEKAVRGATLIGNGPDVLMNIDAVGSDLGFGIGTCGKEDQWVPITDAQPTIRIKELTIGGTA